MGVTQIDNILMILGVSRLMTELEKEKITKEMIRGFTAKANEAGTSVTGGQSVFNPWPIIGGTAISVVKKDSVIYPNYSQAGDVLVLTKPLGMQVLVNLMQWHVEKKERWDKALEYITQEELYDCFDIGQKSMTMLNLRAAELMKRFKVHACTDVTGFGIKGHIENLAVCQKESLKFIIRRMPIISKMDVIDDKIFTKKLRNGYSAETSGGLLIVLSKEEAEEFCDLMHKEERWAWIIGEVVKGDREVEIDKDLEFVYV